MIKNGFSKQIVLALLALSFAQEAGMAGARARALRDRMQLNLKANEALEKAEKAEARAAELEKTSKRFKQKREQILRSSNPNRGDEINADGTRYSHTAQLKDDSKNFKTEAAQLRAEAAKRREEHKKLQGVKIAQFITLKKAEKAQATAKEAEMRAGEARDKQQEMSRLLRKTNKLQKEALKKGYNPKADKIRDADQVFYKERAKAKLREVIHRRRALKSQSQAEKQKTLYERLRKLFVSE